MICLIAFAFRLYIRYHCFQKLLIDDWIMMFALTLLLTVVALGQAFLGDVYTVVDFENGDKIPDASFPDTLLKALRGFGASLTVALVGILAVKINFLLFFKRLGTQITMYLVFWYIVLFITVACGAINIGLMDYKCVFGELSYTLSKCIRRSTIKRYFVFQKVSVILDVISDFFSKFINSKTDTVATKNCVLVICFPVLILWNVRIGLRKKIILSCTFGLVALTIAVTIVRGSVFGGTYKSFDKNENRNLNMGWMWFWIFIEFSVGTSAACIRSSVPVNTISVSCRLHHIIPGAVCPKRESIVRTRSTASRGRLAGAASHAALKWSGQI